MALAEAFWSVDSRFAANDIFYHGVNVVLPSQILLALLLVILPYQGPFILVISICVSCFISGVLGVFVARKNATKKPETELKRTVPKLSIGTRGRCPTCGESFRYTSRDTLDNGMVRCLSCHQPFIIEFNEEMEEKIGKLELGHSDTDL